jgi:Tfp pilus assembly protein PilZ
VDNRKDKRFKELDNVYIKDREQVQKTASGSMINAYTHDLSVSGAWICSKGDFPVGSVIRIVIELDDAEGPFEVDGKVVWTRKSKNDKRIDTGVEFLHRIPATVLSLIKHFYRKKLGVPTSVS